MKHKFPNTLRAKITCMSIVILSFMCILLTIITQNSSNNLVASIQTMPAAEVSPEVQNSSILEESIPIEIEDVAQSDMSVPAYPITELSRATRTFHSSIWISMFLAVGFGSLIIYLYTKKLLQPLETLTCKVQDIQVTNLNQSFALEHTTDEIQQLSESFQNMVERIHNAYVMQKNFSSNAAHELRTPLAILQTQLDVFQLENSHKEQEITEFITLLQEHSKRLTNIVTELLELTNEQEVPMKQEIYVLDIFEELFIELEDAAMKHHITLELCNKTTSSTPIIYGNDGLLERAFFNLLENAIKYNVPNGKVLVTLEEVKHQLSIKISDTGIGIPTKEQKKVFEPFYRVDKSRSRMIGGSGLGLALVEKIIEKHHGTITISDNKPQGTCFTLTF